MQKLNLDKDQIAWITLVATVMNLDVNLQILEVNKQRLADGHHQTRLLETIVEELKNNGRRD